MAFKWTPEADNFLRNYYPTTDSREIAKELGVTLSSVSSRACALKIKKVYSEVPKGYRMCSRCKKVHYVGEKRGNGYCNDCRRELYWEAKEKRVIEEAKKAKGIDKIETHKKETATHMYTCSKCKKELLGSEFKYDKRRKKRETICNACRKIGNDASRIKSIKEGRGW